MKRNKLLSGLLYGTIAFCIAFCGAGCIVTAFSFTESGAAVSFTGLGLADMQAVALWCAVFSLLSVIVFSQKRKWVFWLAAAVVLGLLAVTGMLEELYSLAYRISIVYNKAYRWGTLPEPSYAIEMIGQSTVQVVKLSDITGGLISVCAFVIFAVNWVLCRQRKAAVAIVAGGLPLAVCCVVTDTVPDERYLFPLLCGLVLVMLTGTARRSSEKAGAQLTAILMVPVLLVSMLLSNLMPRESYELQSEDVLQTMLRWVQDLPFVVQGPDGRLDISITGTAPDNVDLAAVGPIAKANYPVMDVVSAVTQKLYLRGQSFDTYDGKSWTNSDKSNGVESAWPQRGRDIGTVTIKTRSRLAYRFVPYYTKGNRVLENGAVADPEGNREYSYMMIEPAYDGVGAMPSATVVCMTLDEKTQEEAEKFVDMAMRAAVGKYEDLKVRERKAKIIEEYVKNSAAYSLNTPQMPEDVENFALWFLENGETGYCVHFATAAVVLLRAAGIPARYVTGYAVEVTAGQKVTVTAEQSHAWVEYLNDNNVWTVLDATPAEGMEENPTQPETQSTEPPVTEPTAPTLPDSTDPPSTGTPETRPNQPTDPTGVESGQQKQETDRTALWTALCWVAGILSTAAALAGQYFLRRQLRRKKMVTGHPNRQALMRWREIKRMAMLTKQQIPEELEILAEKAKFSQHTLTRQELAQMNAYLKQAQQLLRARAWPVQLVIRLIWAV